ncbi:hypothetical protein MCHI_001343 [Candidatus Magnetoovum chiemensis]|nr:hypothetical protein MCHI_001343 [Candidatus Magnetoovum chiemensis]
MLESYSVEIEMRQKDAPKQITGVIYYKDGLVRQELQTEEGTQIIISRPDLGVLWMIQPEKKTIFEMVDSSDNVNKFGRWSNEKN